MILSSTPHSIALHIGAHKTASSHLQKVLFNNRKMLMDNSIRVCGPWILRRKGGSLASQFGLSWSETAPPRRSAQEQLAFLSKGAHRLVLSEENFVGMLKRNSGRVHVPLYPTGPEKLAELVAKFAPIKPQIFLAVREPTAFLTSAYSQTLFGGAFIGPRTFRARNDWRSIDWADYVARLLKVDGLGGIYLWRQEDYEQVQRRVLRQMLRWRAGGQVETIDGRVHESLSAAAVRQTLAWAQEGETVKLATKARQKFPVSEVNKPFKLYAPSTLKMSEAIYDVQMAQIEQMEGVAVLHPSNQT